MFVKRGWFPLLLVGFLTTFLLSVYFIIMEKQGPPSRIRFVEIVESVTPGEKREINNKETMPSLSYSENTFKIYDEVETFVMFIGYPRSSHSLVGAILDAHPEIIIPHEYNLIGKWDEYRGPLLKKKKLQKYKLFYDLHQLSTKQALFGIRASSNRTLMYGKFAYTYNVPDLWQGGYQKRIKVIGDKKGGLTTEYLQNPHKFNIIEEISQVVQVPMKFIHVNRNPFDNIATMMLRTLKLRDSVRGEEVKVNDTRNLELFITRYFRLAASNQRVRERFGDAVIDIPGHETVLRPKVTLQRLCDHLGVTCSEDYIEKCSKILYGTPSVTRNKVVWTEKQIQRVTEEMKSYPFMKDYSFDRLPS